MQKNWKQMLLAFVMGMVLPAMALPIGLAQRQETPPAESTGMPVTQPQPQSVWIPVLHTDGTRQQMELDSYVLCVLLAEMPADFEVEALKAQAVAARTVALRCVRGGDRHAGAICTDSKCCQAYMTEDAYRADGGTAENISKIRSAVESTREQVLTYGGELIEAVYFSCSGGYTEDAAAVWGNDVPYLQAVASPGEEGAAAFAQTLQFTAAEFAACLDRQLSGSPESWMGPVSRTEGGGVATMVIGGKTYTGTQLRTALGLASTAFTISVAGQTITVQTVGLGHRVGMSQYGADAMAVTGSSYEEILAHYYQGARIDKISALG